MSEPTFGASNSIVLRLQIVNQPGRFARAVSAIGDAGGSICADYIIPGVFNKDVARNPAEAVKRTAGQQ